MIFDESMGEILSLIFFQNKSEYKQIKIMLQVFLMVCATKDFCLPVIAVKNGTRQSFFICRCLKRWKIPGTEGIGSVENWHKQDCSQKC